MTAFDALLALQDLDTKVDQLRHRLSHLPERAAVLALEQQAAAVITARAAVERERAVLAEQEHVLAEQAERDASRRREIAKRLAASTVPKEVQALSAEQAQLEGHQRALEDKELELMEAIEPLDARLAALDADRDRLDIETADARVALAEVDSGTSAELQQVLAGRAEVAAAVDPSLLATYDKMRPKFGGIAIARLDAGHCTGCHLQLPATELDRIRHEPPDALINCEQCGRILVR